jgi:hypothetical protein
MYAIVWVEEKKHTKVGNLKNWINLKH